MSTILMIGALVALPFVGKSHAQNSKEDAPRTHPISKIDGYGPYKFGMSIEQAKAASPSAKRIEGNCGYDKLDPPYCLTETTEFFGQVAEIAVLFNKNTKRLSTVLITFDRSDGKENEKACKKVLDAVVPPLFEKWGVNTRKDGPSFFWESPYGGRMTLENVCIRDDFGVVLVSYEDTPGF
jgi:hypothetical protein